MDSVKSAKTIYAEMGAEGLAKIIDPLRTKKSIIFLKKFLNKNESILDLGCGYGRIIMPLAKCGYNIEGIDISKELAQSARHKINKENLKAKIKIGDIRTLPYAHGTFDKIICIWSTFNHLLTKKDQHACINEIYRVLKPGGIALIEMVNGNIKAIVDDLSKNGFGNGRRINSKVYAGTTIVSYIHNKDTIKAVCKNSYFKQFKIRLQNFGGRRRLMVYLYKD
jgi:ubiquinone/menaquinone biosynthesis C-methylase UbiE